jgi:hypothetical protein
MRILYFTIQFLPYWAIPTLLILLEVGFVLRKRGHGHWFNRLMLLSAMLFVLIVLFFIFRWDQTAFPYLRDRMFHQ